MTTANAIDHRLAYWQNFKHYEGHLFFKVHKVGYEKRWIVLLGNEIHVYGTKISQRDQGSVKPIQHYPLHKSVSITIDHDYKMHIKCELWTIRAQATSNEERENWRIRILTIARGETPDQGRLLPGQQELLADILQKETARKMNQGRPVGSRRGSLPGMHFTGQPTPGRRRGSSFNDGPHQYTDNAHYKFLPEDIAFSQVLPPVWFFGKVSRLRAEEILHQSTSSGDILLRESEAHPGQYTLSVRQDTDSKTLIRHYMFKKNPYGFILLIEDKPPVLNSMYELMWFFIQESGGHLLPIQKDPNLPPTIYDVSVPSPPYKDPATGELSSKQGSRGPMRKSSSMDDHMMSSHHHHSHVTSHEANQEAENEYLVPDNVSPQKGPVASSSKSPLGSVSESFDDTFDTYSPADMPLRDAPRPPSSASPHHPAPPSPSHHHRSELLLPSTPSPSHHHRSELSLPSPPEGSTNLTTDYVKMRSFSSSPALQHGRRQDDGYINMKKQSSFDEGCGPDGAWGSGKNPTPPPLPRKSRSHHGYCTHLKSVPEELGEGGVSSPLVQHLKPPLRPTHSCPPANNLGELQKAFKRFGLREEDNT